MARTERTRQEVHDDDLWLNLTLAGQRAVWHCGREAVFGDGEALLSTGSQASRNAFSDTRFISFRVPFKPIAALVPDVEDHLCRPIRRDVEALRLLAGYGGALMEDACSSPEMQRLVTTHVYDLVALALGAGRDTARVAAARGGQAARLRTIKADIEDNLERADLSPATLAARHRMPLRYLQRLFEADGIACTEYVLKRRLARAHQLLREPQSFERPIRAVALAAGFSHLSRFNRAFRLRFGQTPSDVRAQAQRENWVLAQHDSGAARAI
jgi:AraC-like DNA-binding protein